MNNWNDVTFKLFGKPIEVLSFEYKETVFHQGTRKLPPKGIRPSYIFGWRCKGCRIPRKSKKFIKKWLKSRQ